MSGDNVYVVSMLIIDRLVLKIYAGDKFHGDKEYISRTLPRS